MKRKIHEIASDAFTDSEWFSVIDEPKVDEIEVG